MISAKNSAQDPQYLKINFFLNILMEWKDAYDQFIVSFIF
jgi:hypothetical protein